MAKKKEENPFVELIASAKASWRVRQGINIPGLKGKDRLELRFGKVHKTFYLDNYIPGLIEETFANLGYETKDGKKPALAGKCKTNCGWHLVFHLPPGQRYKDVLNHKDYFENATNSSIEIKWHRGKLHMNIQCGNIPEKAEYAWEPAEGYLPVPIGYGHNGQMITLELADAPHFLIAGVPGFGKSNYLHTLIHSLLPTALIGIIDLKRLEFSYLKDHCALAKTEDEALQMMHTLNRIMEQRIDKLDRLGVVKVQDYPGEDMPFIALVVDELAEIHNEEILCLIDRIVRLARAVGISVVGATQRPSTRIMSGDTRAMFAARLCFQVADELNSRMVLGESCSAAAHLPGIKGRAIYKFGIIEEEVQTMFLPLAKAKQILPQVLPERWWNYEQPKTKRLTPR